MAMGAGVFAIECLVYTGKIDITHRFGSGAMVYSVSESRQVELGGDIGKLLKDAAAGELHKQDGNFVLDGEAISILGGSDKFVLFS